MYGKNVKDWAIRRDSKKFKQILQIIRITRKNSTYIMKDKIV